VNVPNDPIKNVYSFVCCVIHIKLYVNGHAENLDIMV